MKRFLLAAVAAMALSAPAFALEAGLGIGGVGASALSGSNTGVQSTTGIGAGTGLLGASRSSITSRQTATGAGIAAGQAGCVAGTCTAQAEHQQENATVGRTSERGGALGLGGSIRAGQSGGIAGGNSIGAGQANYTFGSIFVR